jgi:hypothetical protein
MAGKSAKAGANDKGEEIGKYLRFFASSVGGDKCLISAHGGYVKNNSSFKLSSIGQGTTVFFYGEHTKVLSDPGLDLLAKRPVIVQQHPAPDGDDIMDYVLSKYQGKHSGAGETYSKITTKLAFDATRKASYEAEDTWEYVLRTPAIKRIYDSLATSHVVTIRNRWWKSDISLKYVIETVRALKPAVTEFHCSFCRSLVGDANPGVSNVQSMP